MTHALAVAALLWLAGGCDDTPPTDGDGDADGDGDGDVEPVTLDPSDFTYVVEESPADVPLWTTPATRRLAVTARPPEATRSGLHLSAARRELEPLQIVLGPASGAASLSVAPFPDLGADQRLTLERVRFRAGLAEGLTPIADDESIPLDEASPVGVWLTLRVPEDAPAGEHETTLTVTTGAGAREVPIALYVYDFAIPEEIHFSSQVNVD